MKILALTSESNLKEYQPVSEQDCLNLNIWTPADMEKDENYLFMSIFMEAGAIRFRRTFLFGVKDLP